MSKLTEIKEQLQEDILTITSGYDGDMCQMEDYLCDAVLKAFAKIENEKKEYLLTIYEDDHERAPRHRVETFESLEDAKYYKDTYKSDCYTCHMDLYEGKLIDE